MRQSYTPIKICSFALVLTMIIVLSACSSNSKGGQEAADTQSDSGTQDIVTAVSADSLDTMNAATDSISNQDTVGSQNETLSEYEKIQSCGSDLELNLWDFREEKCIKLEFNDPKRDVLYTYSHLVKMLAQDSDVAQPFHVEFIAPQPLKITAPPALKDALVEIVGLKLLNPQGTAIDSVHFEENPVILSITDQEVIHQLTERRNSSELFFSLTGDEFNAETEILVTDLYFTNAHPLRIGGN